MVVLFLLNKLLPFSIQVCSHQGLGSKYNHNEDSIFTFHSTVNLASFDRYSITSLLSVTNVPLDVNCTKAFPILKAYFAGHFIVTIL